MIWDAVTRRNCNPKYTSITVVVYKSATLSKDLLLFRQMGLLWFELLLAGDEKYNSRYNKGPHSTNYFELIQGPISLAWINFNTSMDKWLHPLWSEGWNTYPFPKFNIEVWECGTVLGMDKWFHPTFHWACDYLSMVRLNLIHVSKKGAWIPIKVWIHYTDFPHASTVQSGLALCKDWQRPQKLITAKLRTFTAAVTNH